MPVLKYYYDLMSQPCRALYIFLRINNIPFEDKEIAIRKGEHLKLELTVTVVSFTVTLRLTTW